MRPRKRQRRSIVRPAITLAVIVSAWILLTHTALINPLFLPRFDHLLDALVQVTLSRATLDALLLTVYRAMVGLALSMCIAIPSGLLFGRSPRLYEFFELPIDFFRSIPSSALFVLFILFFGVGNSSKIAVVVYGCSLILIVNTVYGAMPTHEKSLRINMLRSFGASRFQIFRYAVIRDALPSICAGIRVCISLSLVLVIVTEMFLGTTAGLGRLIYDAYLSYQIPQMYAVIVLLGGVGFALNRLFSALEQRICFWLPDPRRP